MSAKRPESLLLYKFTKRVSGLFISILWNPRDIPKISRFFTGKCNAWNVFIFLPETTVHLFCKQKSRISWYISWSISVPLFSLPPSLFLIIKYIWAKYFQYVLLYTLSSTRKLETHTKHRHTRYNTDTHTTTQTHTPPIYFIVGRIYVYIAWQEFISKETGC